MSSSSIELKELEGLCRVCLSQTINMIPLFEYIRIGPINLTIYEVLQQIIGTNVPINNKYPSRLCPTCLNVLSTAMLFRKQYEESANFLKDIIDDNLKYETEEDLFINKNIKQEQEDNEDFENPTDSVIMSEGERTEDTNKTIDVLDNSKKTCTNCLCNYCGNIYSRRSNLNRHMKKAHDIENEEQKTIPTPNTVFICYQCEKTFTRKTTLRKHVKTIHLMENLDTRPIICPHCQKECITKSKYSLHLRKEHPDKCSYKYICEICNHVSFNRRSKNYHKLSHMYDLQTCDICKKTFKNKYTLQAHLKIHESPNRFLCSYCGKDFDYQSSLVYHLRLHTGEKNYKCDYCDLTFRMPQTAKRHMRRHTDERPYVCRFCKRGFRSCTEVKEHEATHTGIKNYFCHCCEKGFIKKCNRDSHEAKHEGPFKCDFCSMSFVFANYLNKHLVRSHGVATSEDVEIQAPLSSQEL